MISKVIEEAMENMVRRIEALEDKIAIISIPNKQGLYEKVLLKRFATPGQIWKIKKEGGEPFEGMTKLEATKEIDKLLKINESINEQKKQVKIPEPKEVDTEDAGLEGDLM